MGASGQRSLRVDPDCVLFQKPSKHKKKQRKKEKEERAKDKKKPKKQQPAGGGAAEPVENGALDEDPLPVRGAALAARGSGAPHGPPGPRCRRRAGPRLGAAGSEASVGAGG